MERNDIKEILKEKGVNEKFLEMPAIIEPIYQKYMNLPKSKLLESSYLKVTENGDFSFNGQNYSLTEDGAEITYDDVSISINNYGIETSYSDGSWMGFFSNLFRENGQVILKSGNNGNGYFHRETFLDNGSYSISEANGTRVYEDRDSLGDLSQIDKLDLSELNEEQLTNEFDETSSTIISNYPQTAEWYAKTREALVKRIQKQNDPQDKTERRITRLENTIRDQEREISNLRNRNEKITSMLNKSLNFLSDVKKSPFGRIFFKKEIKEAEQNDHKLLDAK